MLDSAAFLILLENKAAVIQFSRTLCNYKRLDRNFNLFHGLQRGTQKFIIFIEPDNMRHAQQCQA